MTLGVSVTLMRRSGGWRGGLRLVRNGEKQLKNECQSECVYPSETVTVDFAPLLLLGLYFIVFAAPLSLSMRKGAV